MEQTKPFITSRRSVSITPVMRFGYADLEKKSDALRALLEMVEREERCEDEESVQTAIDMLQDLEDKIRDAGGSKN